MIEKVPVTTRNIWRTVESDIRSGMNWRQAIQPYKQARVPNETAFGESMDRFQVGVLSGSNYVQAMIQQLKRNPYEMMAIGSENSSWRSRVIK